MRYLSLFSGIEAASVAWEPLGWEPVAFCEVDAFPSAVLAHRWPHVPNLGDITKVDWSEYAKGKRKPDVVVGGSPCQSFSVAGSREGLAGESGLMFEYIRAVRGIMPRCFVWENVPGALSSEHGEAFRQLLSEMDALGYGLAWRVLDAQFFGVAQRRERVFLVGCLGDPRRAARVLFEPDGLRWDAPSSREKRKELAARAGRRAGSNRAAGFAYKVSQSAGSIGYEEERAPTLLAGRNDAAALTTSHAQTAFAPVFAIDCATTPKARADVFRTMRHGGSAGTTDAVAVPVTQFGDIAGTLTARDSSPCADRGMNVVATPAGQESLTPWDVQSRRVYGSGATWPALYAGEGGGHGYVLVGPVCLGDDNAKASCDVDMCGALKVGGSAPVVTTTGFAAWSSEPAPMEETAPTLTAGRAGDSSAAGPYDVRRLTPTECERLQGFPDGHTDLTGANPDELFERMVREDMGEAERKRLRTKLRKWCGNCPDTPRYKACGNSMAVPVMRWIGERIERAEVPL